MNGKIITDEVYMSEGGPLSPEDASKATHLVVALMAQGHKAEGITGILSDALAQAIVAFSPDAETAVKNMTEVTHEMVDCVKNNFTSQKSLIGVIESRLHKMMPLAAMLKVFKETAKAAKASTD